MRKGVRYELVFLVLVFVFSFVFSANFAAAQDKGKGNVIGFLYAKDGTTPLPGAIVKFKNLTSGTIYESTKSDNYGIFKLQGIESGVYVYGVVTEEGDYNAASFVGLKIDENDTAKLSIALDPYEKEVAEAVSEIIREQEMSGEALVGTIADFNSGTKMAQVQVVKGMLRVKDRIHAKGRTTDFYQDVNVLRFGSSPAKQLLKGQTGTVQLNQQANKGDLIFVVNNNRNIMPFFLAPVGVAAVIAGNTFVTYGIVIIPEGCKPQSAKRN
ncbi:MAG: hypothetical protein QHH14_13115 [Clostridiales bacterium]|nr:hypothetical protein [Clostridiales bacterium]